MSLATLRCGILGHDSSYMLPLKVLLDAELDSSVPLTTVAARLDEIHRGCPCGRTVSASISWQVDISWSANIGFIWEELDLCQLRRLDGSSPIGAVQPVQPASGRRLDVIFGLDPPVEDAATLQVVRGVRRLEGDVCRVYGRFSNVSLPRSSEFSSVIDVPGALFVYKADRFIECYCPHYGRPRLPVIHRPKGFGKTTFLSAIESYFDLSMPSATRPPYPESRYRETLPPADVLVLRLDFADLTRVIQADATFRAVVYGCAAYLERELSAFYNKYSSIFDSVAVGGGSYCYAYANFLNALMITGHRVFLGIDNYTSPAIDFSGILRSWICAELWEQFMGPALRDVGSLIWGGLLTGCSGYPFLREPEFEQTTEDLSSIDDYIGFSRDDIVHLGRAALGSELSAAAIGNVSDSSEALISAASATAVISKLMKDKTTNPTVGLPRGVTSLQSDSNESMASSDGPPAARLSSTVETESQVSKKSDGLPELSQTTLVLL